MWCKKIRRRFGSFNTSKTLTINRCECLMHSNCQVNDHSSISKLSSIQSNSLHYNTGSWAFILYLLRCQWIYQRCMSISQSIVNFNRKIFNISLEIQLKSVCWCNSKAIHYFSYLIAVYSIAAHFQSKNTHKEIN